MLPGNVLTLQSCPLVCSALTQFHCAGSDDMRKALKLLIRLDIY